MNRRALVLAAILILSGIASRGQDTKYTVKVTEVNKAAGEIQAKFVVMPQDLRIVCHGDVKTIFTGDYVQIDINTGDLRIGNAKCTEIRWLH